MIADGWSVCGSQISAGDLMDEPTYTLLDFEDLTGWADDDHRAALDIVLHGDAAGIPIPSDARSYIEKNFCPVLIEDGAPMLFTGYFEPELKGSRSAGGDYQFPIYSVPPDLVTGTAYLTRRQIEEDLPLAGRGLEMAWLADPVDLFFLHVQGSGRLKLTDGSVMRVGFGAKNGHDYTSIGKALVARGAFSPEQMSPALIRDWVKDKGAEGHALLWENESYVFFRQIDDIPADKGPLGAMNLSITAGRSIAVDPRFVPLGSLVWIEKLGRDPMKRLMVAQDTGSAIKGAQRADIFFGTGEKAGSVAGAVKDGGRMVVLLPVAVAQSLVQAGH